MNLYLGIDGGGTKTKITIINELDEVIFENISGPSSMDTVSNDVTLSNIIKALKPYTDQYPDCYFTGVFVGLGGIVFDKDCRQIEEIVRTIPQTDHVTLIKARNDMYNALYSSNRFDKAMTLICGTGMVAFGKHKGKTHKCGGWGYKEGELGSAFHLGTEAIRHCIRAFAKRYPMDKFAEDIANQISISRSTDIIGIMDHLYGNRTLVAKLAPLVTKHANLGNERAKEIVDYATSEIALAVKGVYTTLQFQDVPLVVVGSLGNSKGYFKDQLHQKIQEISTSIHIMEPIIDPSLAAAFAAKRLGEKR